jgi:hypothetical protein
MSAIRIFRPKKNWSVSPRTVLPTGLLFHLFRPHSNYTVVLDDHPVGKIGNEQVRVFEVEPGEHRLHMRFVGLRRSEELRMSLKDGEERQFLCGTSGLGRQSQGIQSRRASAISRAGHRSIRHPPR